MAPLTKPAKGTAKRAKAKRKAAKLSAWRKVCKAVDKRDGPVCRVCLQRFTLYSRREHHHILARSLGGKDTTANVLSLCASCHFFRHSGALVITGNADDKLVVRTRGI